MIEVWCKENHEEALLDALAKHSLTMLQTENPNSLIAKAQEWIAAPQTKSKNKPTQPPAAVINLQKLGLRALMPMINDPKFENLPKIYNSLRPIFESPPKVLRPDLLDILRLLAERSPAETAYFLRGLHTEITLRNPDLAASQELEQLPR